jgi:hypothetical protein
MRNTFVNTPIRKVVKSALIAVAVLVMVPTVAVADTASEVKAMIMQGSADTRKNLATGSDDYSKHGSLEFWSSGGLMQHIAADSPAATYEQFALTPKHIKVITLVEGQAAVAMYYSEGSFQEAGQKSVSHYMTRVTDVYVKENGKWKTRAAHYSPIAAGQGTQQTAVD